MRKRFWIPVLFLIIAVMASACAQATPPVASEATEPAPTEAQVEERTIRIAMPTVSSFRQLDPHDAAGSNMGLLENMYEALVGIDIETLAPYPLLAESWSAEDDNTRYVFALRQGVKFHDGTDLTSDDVKLSFERIVALEKSFGWERLQRIQEIRTPDDYTVEFIVEPGASPFPVDANSVKIVSADAVRANEVDGDFANAWFKDNVVGTGPYVLQEWRQNDRWVLARNEEYWGEKPYFTTAVVLDVPEASTQGLMIQGGEVDIALNVPSDSVEQLTSMEGLTVVEEKGVYNLSLRLLSQGDTPTSDPYVRRAIAYATNYDRIWTVRGKDLVATDGPIPATFVDEFVPPNLYEYDLEKAREELAQSSYPEGGFTLSVVIPPEDPQQQTAMEILQTDLASLNIELDIQVRDWVPVYQQFLEWKSEDDAEASRDLQGLTLGMPPLVVDASNYMQIYDCESSLNFIAYCNPEVDQLLEDADGADGFEERNELYRQAIELILEDSPDIYLGLNNTIAVIRDDIQGFMIHRIWHPYGVDIDSLSR